MMDYFVVGLTGLVVCFAYWKHKIDFSAIILTAIFGLAALYWGGVSWVVVLLLFFVFGTLASAYKKKLKDERGCGQEVRNWENVYGNGMSAFLFAAANHVAPGPIWFSCMYAAMTCALADTCATEIGQIYGRNPRLLYDLRHVVPIGTDGAVSLEGLGAAATASTLFPLPLLFYAPQTYPLVVVASFTGTVFDSVLGSTLEQKKWITTHDVNFITTLASGIIVFVMST